MSYYKIRLKFEAHFILWESGLWWLSAQVAQVGRLEQLPVLLVDKPVDVVDVD